MTALRGRIDEWEADKDGRWSRKDHPEDGVITLTPPLTFAGYFARRAEPDPLPPPDPLAVKIAALEAQMTLTKLRVDKLEIDVVAEKPIVEEGT